MGGGHPRPAGIFDTGDMAGEADQRGWAGLRFSGRGWFRTAPWLGAFSGAFVGHGRR
jgi:hypothetical protein